MKVDRRDMTNAFKTMSKLTDDDLGSERRSRIESD